MFGVFYGPQLHNLVSLAFAATSKVFEDIKSLYTPDAKRHKNAKDQNSQCWLRHEFASETQEKQINEKALTGPFEGSWYKEGESHLLTEMLKHSRLQMHFRASVRLFEALLQMSHLI